MVIGSEIPWVEACVLEAGAREVLTLEYGSIISQHPKVKTIVPFDFRMRYLNNTLGTFDAIVTYSSIKHSGLGRNGDALNPWGDIIAIARAWCVTKNGGSLTIGIPYNHDHEELVFNAHRTYGKIRHVLKTSLQVNEFKNILNMEHRKTCSVLIFIFVISCTVIPKYFVQPIANSTTFLINMYNNKRTTSIRSIPAPKKELDPLDDIRQDCGQLCNTSRKGSPGQFLIT
ncbi:unnamed protein product [Mytilus coruscus]|uniref:Uncharacterized protein n=1 Tax=Mytilus coruscus TaxID=42192 RepID=A0A6J8ETJ7_MYTCO|nr:unnamed protein product [Mytilus coruscus]